jgi:hypothetical protein
VCVCVCTRVFVCVLPHAASFSFLFRCCFLLVSVSFPLFDVWCLPSPVRVFSPTCSLTCAFLCVFVCLFLYPSLWVSSSPLTFILSFLLLDMFLLVLRGTLFSSGTFFLSRAISTVFYYWANKTGKKRKKGVWAGICVCVMTIFCEFVYVVCVCVCVCHSR